MGHVRHRMPERKHYDCPLINNCYVYTLDSEYAEGLTNSIDDSFYTYLYKCKFEALNIVLQKEFLNDSDRYAVKPEAIEGVARTTHDIRSLNRIFGGEH